MAIKEIVGFSDLPDAARRPTVILLGKGIVPGYNPGDTSANVSSAVYGGRKWLRIVGTYTPYVSMSLKAWLGFTEAEIRTKKIWGGFRYVVPNNNLTKTTDTILRLDFSGISVNYDMVLETDHSVTTDEVFIEYMIDLQNDTLMAWVDGVLKKTQAVDPALKTSATECTVRYGQLTNASTGETHHYNDFYWVIDTSDVDTSPSKRLGPIKVKSVLVNDATIPQDWTIPEGYTPAQILDTTTLAPTTELSPAIRTSPAESVASIGFAAPQAEFDILAVSVEVFGFRDTGTAPSIDAQLKQGEVTLPKLNFTVPTNDLDRGYKSDRLGCLNTDLNGQKWTPSSIDALEVLINSKTGG